MTPTWYDVLGVTPDATPDEIRAAWKDTIAPLDPGDRRFRLANEAGELLLDPERRASYDAELAAAAEPLGLEPFETVAEQPPQEPTGLDGPPQPAGEESQQPSVPPVEEVAQQPSRNQGTARPIPTWLLAVVAVATALVVGVTAWVWVTTDSDAHLADAARDAQAAAEEAVVPVLSYDVATLEQDRATAVEYLTDDFRAEYDRLFDGIVEENAPDLGTKVTWEVLASGLVRSDADRAQVFVLLDQQVTNKQQTEPATFHNHVTVSMERVGDRWLLDGLSTASEQ